MSSFAVDLASQVNIPSFADSVFPKLKCTVAVCERKRDSKTFFYKSFYKHNV